MYIYLESFSTLIFFLHFLLKIIPTATINIIDMEMITKADSTMIIQALFVNGVACVAAESRIDDSDGAPCVVFKNTVVYVAPCVIVDDSNTD